MKKYIFALLIILSVGGCALVAFAGEIPIPKQYVDTKLSKTGGTMTSDINMGGHNITDSPIFTNISSHAMSGGGLIGIKYLASGTTYTPDAGTNTIVIRMVGAGGGGGYSNGGGGGAGGYLQKRITSFSGTASYSIGVGGSGGVNGTQPTAGGNTTFTYGGTTYTAYGGSGGQNTADLDQGIGASASVNGDLNFGGGCGGFGATGVGGGTGGTSFFGGGGADGMAGLAPGSGGGGGNGATNGGAGAHGLIIVQEYN